MFDTRVCIDKRHSESTATIGALGLSSSSLLLLGALPAVRHGIRVLCLFTGQREYKFSFYFLQLFLLQVLSFVFSVYNTLEL